MVIINNAAVNMWVHLSLQIKYFHFLQILRTGPDGSHGSSVINFFRKRHNVFHMDAPVYIANNSTQGLPFLHDPDQRLLFVVFLITAILTGVRECLTMLLTCIGLTISDVGHLFI